MALAQAWDRFLFVYKKTLVILKSFSFEKDPEEFAREQAKDPSIKVMCAHRRPAVIEF
jgi:hypothetical protein